jgi:hypothetical protein
VLVTGVAATGSAGVSAGGACLNPAITAGPAAFGVGSASG